MTPEQFCYWLQGFFEISTAATIDNRQAQVIKDHLATVLDKRTPDRANIADVLKTYPSDPKKIC